MRFMTCVVVLILVIVSSFFEYLKDIFIGRQLLKYYTLSGLVKVWHVTRRSDSVEVLLRNVLDDGDAAVAIYFYRIHTLFCQEDTLIMRVVKNSKGLDLLRMIYDKKRKPIDEVIDGLSMTITGLAISSGNVEVAKWAVENGAKIDAADTNGFSLLSLAVIFGKVDSIRYLMDDAKVSPHSMRQIEPDFACILTAVRRGNFEIFKSLVVYFDVDELLGESEKISIMSSAVCVGGLEMSEFLLNKWPERINTLVEGHSLLILALKCSQLDTAISLIKRGCDVNLTCPKNRNAMHYAVLANSKRVVHMLYEFGLNFDTMTLTIVIMHGMVDMMKMMKTYGHRTDVVTDSSGTTIPTFHFAIVLEQFEIANLILKYGGSVRMKQDEIFEGLILNDDPITNYLKRIGYVK